MEKNYQKSFPSELKKYLTFFSDLSNDNICEKYLAQTSSEVITRPVIANFANCTVLHDITLKKGLKTSFLSIPQYSWELNFAYFASARDQAAQTKFLNEENAQILEIFKVSGAGKVAGSKVIEGEINSNSEVRIIRDGTIIFTGKVASLFREKNQVKQVSIAVIQLKTSSTRMTEHKNVLIMT